MKSYKEAVEIVRGFEHSEWMNVQNFKSMAMDTMYSESKRNKYWKSAEQCEIVHNAINRVLIALIHNEEDQRKSL